MPFSFASDFFAPGMGLREGVSNSVKPHRRAGASSKVLLIDDDLEFAEILADILEEELGIFVDCVTDVFEGAQRLGEVHYDALIVDWFRPRAGLEDRIRVRLEIPESPGSAPREGTYPVIILTSHDLEKLELEQSPKLQMIAGVSKRQTLTDILEDLRICLDPILRHESESTALST